MSTNELVEAAREGDLDAQKAVAAWLYDELAPIIRKRIPDHSHEDVHHRAMQAIKEKLPTEAPREVARVSKWARGFARNEILTYWAEVEKEAGRAADVDVDELAKPATSSRPRELLVWLLNPLLRRLPRQYGSPLLRALNGERDSKIAADHGVAKATVRWRKHEGRKMLRTLFSRYLEASSSSRRRLLEPVSSSDL